MVDRSAGVEREFSVGGRLRSAFGLVVLLLAATGAIAAVALLTITSGLGRLVDRDFPALSANASVLQAMTDAETGVRGYLVTGNQAFLEPFRSGSEALPVALDRSVALADGNPELAESLREQSRLAQVWLDEFAVPIISLRGGDPPAAQALAVAGGGKARFDAFRRANAVTDDLLESRSERNRRHAELMAWVAGVSFAALVAAGVATAIVVSVRTTKKITRPLRHLTDTLARLTDGAEEVRALEGGPTEVSEVARSVNALASANAELKNSLRASAEHLAAVLRGATEHAIISCDTSGTITVFNEGAERMLGYRSADLIGRSSPALFHDEGEIAGRAAELGLEPGFEVFVADARGTGSESREWTYVRRDGSRLPVMLTVSGMHDPTGETTGFIGIATDISSQRRAQAAQQQALEREREAADRLRELDRAKSALVASVSHELRTPLTSITGYLEMLLDGDAGPVNGQQRDWLDIVDRNAQRLLTLIQDLLTLSRIESNAFQLKMAPTEVASLFQGVRAAMVPVAARQALTLRMEVDPMVGVIEADADQLERVLLNLVSNAIKFTPPGGTVAVSAHRTDSEVVFVVQDNGIGIPATEQPKLFNPFFRSSTAQQKAIQGTGLGLAIVKTIVERHNGGIALTSTEGVGTTVRVRLPAAPVSVSGRQA